MANDKLKFSTGTVVDSTGKLYDRGYNLSGLQSLNASGAVTAGIKHFVFEATAVPTASIAATIADASYHEGLCSFTQNTTDTVGHTITIATGTFDGTNSVATFDAANESLWVVFDSDGAGTIVLNSGSVSVS